MSRTPMDFAGGRCPEPGGVMSRGQFQFSPNFFTPITLRWIGGGDGSKRMPPISSSSMPAPGYAEQAVRKAIRNVRRRCHLGQRRTSTDKAAYDAALGRESRTITLAVDTPQAKWLWQAAAEAGGGMRVSVGSAKRLADEVARLGRRLWPRKRDTVSPYSYRHAFAADVKTQHPEDWDAIAAALGHSVPETQRHYGRAKQSRGGGGRFLGIVATESPKGRRNKKPYPEKDPEKKSKVAPRQQG